MIFEKKLQRGKIELWDMKISKLLIPLAAAETTPTEENLFRHCTVRFDDLWQILRETTLEIFRV